MYSLTRNSNSSTFFPLHTTHVVIPSPLPSPTFQSCPFFSSCPMPVLFQIRFKGNGTSTDTGTLSRSSFSLAPFTSLDWNECHTRLHALPPLAPTSKCPPFSFHLHLPLTPRPPLLPPPDPAVCLSLPRRR